MTGTSGRHSAPPGRRTSPVLLLVGYVVGVLASAAAWFFLVRAAIHFGTEARAGETAAWTFLGVTVVGAICCLLLALVFLGRLLMAVGVLSDYEPRRAQRRR